MKRFLLLILAAATLLPSCIEKTYPVIKETIIREKVVEPGSYVQTGYIDVPEEAWVRMYDGESDGYYFRADISGLEDVLTAYVVDYAMINLYRVYYDEYGDKPTVECLLPMTYPTSHYVLNSDGAPVLYNYLWYLDYDICRDGRIVLRYTHSDFCYPDGFNPGTMSFKLALVINAD